MADSKIEPYLPKVAEKAIRKTPGLFIVEVIHDDDCAHWEGKSCNCDPEVRDPVRIIDPGSDSTFH